MKKFLKYFKYIKWYEYVYISLLICIVLALGIVFHSDALVICNSILGILAVYLIAKGYIFSNVVEIASMLIYCFISFQNRFYGETIINAILSIAYAINLASWLKNKYRNTGLVKVSKDFNLKEFLLVSLGFVCAGVGVYFMLRVFDTANLVLSTISVVLGFFAVYFMIRRSALSYIFYILSDVICACLWATVVFAGNLNYLPTLVNYAIFIALNIFGFVNWIKLMKSQTRKLRKPKKERKKKLKDTENLSEKGE